MLKRVSVKIEGAVQGVGFRPFVYRLAKYYNLKGSVNNSSEGVTIEAEGNANALKSFLYELQKNKPAIAQITNFQFSFAEPVGFTKFEIIKSKNNLNKSVLILPDIAVCSECKEELFTPGNRRYLYPFINCTNCGPRFSIIESIPYDRQNTSMKNFVMCDYCSSEYENPSNRRFHAQPVACPQCGPHVQLLDCRGRKISEKNDAVIETARLLKEGKIVALKGLGGFQLIADASNFDTVKKLRERKGRLRKPFALMAPEINSISEVCFVNETEKLLLISPQAPIVILKRKKEVKTVCSLVAPGNPYLGFMLPYTPLHLILLNYFKRIIIATSGNLTDEPMCIDNDEALHRLNGIADFFLVHNRKIVRHVDDSIVKVIDGKPVVLRRARGYAPMPIILNENNHLNPPVIIAVGAQLKNTVSVKIRNKVYVSQHLGNLSTEVSFEAFKKMFRDIPVLYDVQPGLIIRDKHPDYLSSIFSGSLKQEKKSVQHHLAHVAGCRAENNLKGKTLGVAWDGTGYGLDGNIWGGEFFLLTSDKFAHIAQFKNFILPGGEKAIKEPPRSALGLLYSYFGEEFAEKFILFEKIFGKEKFKLLLYSARRRINCFNTSSVGRLFDALSALLGIVKFNEFEGEAAMALEFIADSSNKQSYRFELAEENILIVDLKITLEEILKDISTGLSAAVIAAKFHNTLANIILTVAQKFGIRQVLLSGGCFQNKLLVEKSLKLLRDNNFSPFIHRQIPPNDGGISFGQIFAFNLKETKIQEILIK